ncbi:MAG: recombinase RecT [Pseudomonadota bacterium]|nr:recombinase RecT [Pseudomonadota bacterium]
MNNAIAHREDQVVNALELTSIQTQLSELLNNDPQKMQKFKTKVVNMALSFGLKDCTPESIIQSAMQALIVDLPMQNGQGYVVNYSGRAQFDCGYKGWQVLAKRAGYSVVADVVYSCDIFRQEGFGFDVKTIFEPNFQERQGHDDEWAKEHLTGVLVSVRDDSTQEKLLKFVEGGLIHKITRGSPSAGRVSKRDGKKYSPHDQWAEQMFFAKAIKYVLSKMAIDLTDASKNMHEAIEYENRVESQVQNEAEPTKVAYPQERFDQNYPAWKQSVQSGKQTYLSILTSLQSRVELSQEQMQKIIELKDEEPIDAEVSEDVE